MKHVSVVVLAALLGLASATSVAAQERGRSSDDDDARVIIRDRDDDRRGQGRGETGSRRGSDDDNVDRRRGRTGDVERGRAGRTIDDILSGRRSEDGRDRPRRGDDDDWDDDDWDDRRERRRGDDDWDDDDWEDRRERRSDRRSNRGGGPPFCRNGQGHPVHGQAWCREKGFGTGGYGYDDGYWERGRTRDIYFPTRRRNNTLSGQVLEEVLGRSVLGQLDRRARNLRASGPMRGRWNGNSELRVYVGESPIARFVDQNGDRLADVVYLRQ